MIFIMGVVTTISVTAALFGLFPGSSKHYTFYVFLTMIMVSLITLQNHILPALSGSHWQRIRAWGLGIACVIGILSSGHIWINAARYDMIAPFFSHWDVFVGLMLALSLSVLVWTHWGSIISLCLIASIAYFFFGHLLPWPLLAHPKYDPGFIMNYISLNSTTGFYWFAQTTVDDLYYLVIYASVLFGTGSIKVMLELGKLLGSRVAGGAATTSIVGSGITSMVMGVAVSNVQLTGRFTIPLMKKWGYSPAMAGAIEAAASTSGQIMPPVLGLVAFIMTTFLGVAYFDVVNASVYPALLYFTGVIAAVWVFARSNNLPRMPGITDLSVLWQTLPTFLISFFVVCYLLSELHSASLAGLAGSLTALALSALQSRHRPCWADLKTSLDEGFRLVAILAILMIAIGPIGQAFMTTNLSTKLTSVLMVWMPESPLLLLMGIAVLTLIMGAPLPTPVAYLVVALSMVPFLTEMGIPAMTAHFFVFYFAAFSALSPPVAVASLAGAKLAGADLWETTVQSMKIAATTLPIPFVFAYQPSLMKFPEISTELLMVLGGMILSQVTLSLAMYGFSNCEKKYRVRVSMIIITCALWVALIYFGPVDLQPLAIL